MRQRLSIGAGRATLDWEIRDTLPDVNFGLLSLKKKGVRPVGRASKNVLRPQERAREGLVGGGNRDCPDAPGEDGKAVVKSEDFILRVQEDRGVS